MRCGGRAVLIILYPRYSHALYLDSSKNINKKDYTHIKSVPDSAIAAVEDALIDQSGAAALDSVGLEQDGQGSQPAIA